MKTTLAVLIACHNRKGKTINCLRALYQCVLPENHKIDVFLVDDGSSDGTSDAVKTEFTEVNLIKGNGNLYWNRGMHLAWDTAAKSKKNDFYLWLNDDVELFPNAIFDLLKATPNKDSIVVGNMRSRNELILNYGGWTPNWQLIVPNGVPQLCEAFNGNLVLIPVKVYTKLGNLDPIFPHAIGDFDYALRAKKQGIKSYISSDYSGYCEDHALPPKWCLPEIPIRERIKSLYSPLGNSHPMYYFRFKRRHYGLLIAIKHYFTIHFRLLFPQLWKH